MQFIIKNLARGYAFFCVHTLLIGALSLAHAAGPLSAPSGSADTDWQRLEMIRLKTDEKGEEYKRTTNSDPEQHMILGEECLLRYRREGEEFWARHPDDSRRYEWLLNTVSKAPHYFRDIAEAMRTYRTIKSVNGLFDEDAALAWKRRFGAMKTEFRAAPSVSEAQREQLEFRELESAAYAGFAYHRTMSKTEAFEAFESFDIFGRKYPSFTDGRITAVLANILYTDVLTLEEQARLVALLSDNPHGQIRKFALNRQHLLDLQKTPLTGGFMALDGRAVDFGAWRGKVVVIDIWSSWCHPCVGELPKLKQFYDKYHSMGVEMVGVSADTSHTRDGLLKVISKYGVDWPNWFSPEEHHLYSGDLGINILGSKIVLDRDGKLVATGGLHGGMLEQSVCHALGLEPLPAEEASASEISKSGDASETDGKETD